MNFFKNEFLFRFTKIILCISKTYPCYDLFQAASATGHLIKKGGQKVFKTVKSPSFMTGVMVSEVVDDIGDAISESASNDADGEISDSENFYSATDDLTGVYSDYNQYDQYDEEFEFNKTLYDKIARLKNDLKNLRKHYSSAGSPIFKNNFVATVIIMLIISTLI